MDTEIILLNFIINDSRVNVYSDDDNNIIIEGDVYINTKEHTFSKFPIKIHKVIGDFICMNGKLTTLYNFPDIVMGNVNINDNKYLQSLDYCPKHIEGSFSCANCDISDISGLKDCYIGGSLTLTNNPTSNIDILKTLNIKGYVNIIHTDWYNENMYNESFKNIDGSIIAYENDRLRIDGHDWWR